MSKRCSIRKAVLKPTPQTQPDRSPLTMNEYIIIKYLKSTKTYDPSFRDLYKQIYEWIPRMKYFTANEISEMYKSKKHNSIFPFPDVTESIFKLGYQNQLRKLIDEPVFFLMNHGIPFFESRSDHEWTNEEEDLLISISKYMNWNPSFPLLAMCFPGRSGKSIQHHFLKLIYEKKIEIPEGTEIQNKFYLRRYFIPRSEKTLANQIKVMSRKGVQVTEASIRNMAKQYYFSPWIISERATFQLFIKKGIPIFKDEKETEYTEAFLDMYNRLLSNFSNDLKELNIENESDNSKIAESMIDEFGLQKPTFSYAWIKAFLKRNRLSFRHAHFARRGKIDPAYVKIYLNQVAYAVTRYGWNGVYNVDETSVKINNGSTRTVTEVGSENVIVGAERNEKECFTVIGCCTLIKCHELVIVTKGTTDRSKLKFQIGTNEPKILLSKNRNGWTNEEVMLEYLDYFHKQIAGQKECALILDCLAAHRTPAVISKANSLGIELIFVPANGTGYYQPLDRRVFGVLKSKLRSIAGSKAFSGKDRHRIITKHLMEAWDSIKNNEPLLKSAWNMRSLFKLVEHKQKHFGEGDDDAFVIDDTEEEDGIENVDCADDDDNVIEEEEDDDEMEQLENEEDGDYNYDQ